MDFKWKHTNAQAIQFIEERLFSYYVMRDRRVLMLVVDQSPNGGKYLKTQSDNGKPEILLSQPPPTE